MRILLGLGIYIIECVSVLTFIHSATRNERGLE